MNLLYFVQVWPVKLRNPFDRLGVQRSLCGFCRRHASCLCRSSCDSERNRRMSSTFSLWCELGQKVCCVLVFAGVRSSGFFFLCFIFFFIFFFGRVEVVGIDKVWVKIKGGSLVGFVDTTRWSPCTALANLGFISHWHCLFLDWMIVDHCMCSYVLACSVANVCFVWAKSDIYLLCHVLYSYICDKSQRDYKIRKE